MNRINRLFKTALIAIIIVNGSFFIYANLRVSSVSEKVKPVKLAAYRSEKNLTPENIADIRSGSQALKNKITALSATPGYNIIGVTYYEDLISSNDLVHTLDANNTLALSEVKFQPGKSCPVQGLEARWHSFLDSYRIVNNE